MVRDLHFRRAIANGFRRARIAVAVLCLLAAGAHATLIEDARYQVAKFNAEQEKIAADFAQGIQSAEQQAAYEARQAASMAQLREAKRLFEQAGLPKVEDVDLLREYVVVLRTLGDDDLAAEALAVAVDLAPEEGALWIERGECLAAMGPAHAAAAIAALRKGLDTNPEAPSKARAWFQLGRIYADAALDDFARAAYQKVLEFQPEAVRTQIGLAGLDARAGDVASAEGRLDALGRKAAPYDAETRVMLRAALADFDRTRRFFADTAENHGAYGKLLYRAGRLNEAAVATERAVKLAPQDWETLNFLGAIHMQLGSAAGARSAYERSLAVNPMQPDVRRSLESIPVEE